MPTVLQFTEGWDISITPEPQTPYSEDWGTSSAGSEADLEFFENWEGISTPVFSQIFLETWES